MQDKAGHYTIAQLSGLKPTMFASPVQAVAACNATVPRVCTLVLIIELRIALLKPTDNQENRTLMFRQP